MMPSLARTEVACAQSVDAERRAHPMRRETFWAWTESGVPIDVSQAMELDEAVQLAERGCGGHKDGFSLLATDALGGRQVLRCYRIRQGKRQYRVDPITRVHGSVRPLKADCVYATAVNAFDPKQPWRWTPGCDVVGVDRSIIEARP